MGIIQPPNQHQKMYPITLTLIALLPTFIVGLPGPDRSSCSSPACVSCLGFCDECDLCKQLCGLCSGTREGICDGCDLCINEVEDCKKQCREDKKGFYRYWSCPVV